VNRYKLAKFGEDITVQYLTNNNYQILERNFHSIYGEIDIICQKNRQLVFVEVKTRRSNRFGEALAAITNQKKDKIIRAAYEYIAKKDIEISMRFDVVTIKFIKKDNNYAFDHIKNAFFADNYSSKFSSK